MTVGSRSVILLLVAVLAALTLAVSTASALPVRGHGRPATQVRLQVLAIGDFHGSLESSTVGGRPVGVVLNGVPTKSYLYRYGNYDYLAKQ